MRYMKGTFVLLLITGLVITIFSSGCEKKASINENKKAEEIKTEGAEQSGAPSADNLEKSSVKKPEHFSVNNFQDNPHGYFAWPTITRKTDGTIIVSSSGFRAAHIDPWGKTVINISRDNGNTWSEPRIINDSPIDDRDSGIISLGGSKLLLTWFSSDTRWYIDTFKKNMDASQAEAAANLVQSWTEDMVRANSGSWIKISEDGESWGPSIKVPVTAPHGPVKLNNGDILYLGKEYDGTRDKLSNGYIKAAKSSDGGNNWSIIGEVPLPENSVPGNFHEPHIVELPTGKIIGLIRYQHSGSSKSYEQFSMFQTESSDGGKTWSTAKPTGVYGSPPHIIRHTSGALIAAYGYRKKPFGIRAMVSYDEGKTWKSDIVIRDDGVDSDLGYPASVELGDGSVLTVYYKKPAAGGKSSILCTRWVLPEVMKK